MEQRREQQQLVGQLLLAEVGRCWSSWYSSQGAAAKGAAPLAGKLLVVGSDEGWMGEWCHCWTVVTLCPSQVGCWCADVPYCSFKKRECANLAQGVLLGCVAPHTRLNLVSRVLLWVCEWSWQAGCLSAGQQQALAIGNRSSLHAGDGRGSL